ncbi:MULTISPECIES: DUF4406 domain-containing protein [Actinosynnema]|uniref:DUF4406 domain-containing protein n=1 Tax=Actinosynnema TaxID=40566 RepID=UPI0020A5C60C|nr:DUF4406 domain-containing protein [Actinosynnema pretiosum]MCP2096517.1 protein of unknown function (DUF4406) [Actinosynnema pretiosum]
MSGTAIVAAMQAYSSIGLRGAVYVACPISSGKREFDLMLSLGRFDRTALRAELPARWRGEVLEPNRADAGGAAALARSRHPRSAVVNPAAFDIAGLDQPGYDVLCERIIRDHVTRIVLADGWQYSRGARVEAVLAFDLGLPVEDGAGGPMDRDRVASACAEAETALLGSGVPGHAVPALLPAFALDAVPGAAAPVG